MQQHAFANRSLLTMSMENVITQAASGLENSAMLSGETLPEVMHFEMRGKKFKLDRDLLYELPESVLLSLAGAPAYCDQNPPDKDKDGDEELLHMDFSPECFLYILDFFNARVTFLKPRTIPLSNFKDVAALFDNFDQEEQISNNERLLSLSPGVIPDVLRQRPAVVVLREDIEYFCLNGDPHVPHKTIAAIRRQCGDALAERTSIFDGLHDGDVPDTPEYFLKQMLCLAGFSPDEAWGFRTREPNRAQILSMHLLDLKLPQEGQLDKIEAVQKLLLFWRKPARKCWWDGFRMTIDNKEDYVHLRRVWTFELAILGVPGE